MPTIPLLFLEPKKKTSKEPLVDEATRKVTAAFRVATPGPMYRGVHRCSCGVLSSNRNYTLPNGLVTNSLCVHYLAYHRDEVPATEMEKVLKLKQGEAEPTTLELNAPKELGREIRPPWSGFKLK